MLSRRDRGGWAHVPGDDADVGGEWDDVSGEWDIVVVGGGGHVGLPLSIALADRGARVVVLDVSQTVVDTISRGTMPFRDEGAQAALARVLAAGRLRATTDAAAAGRAEIVVVVIGTPVDEHLNPDPHAIPDALAEVNVDVAFCPERIAEGHAMTELHSLPQIVAARSERVTKRAADVFRLLDTTIIELEPEEAELAKLFTNNWRYLKFAVANQFYMIANSHGLDFERIRVALTTDYPRARDLPRAGFAAGPCLFKDTMQLAAFNDNNYYLGHAAMLVNEGLPLYLVQQLATRHDLSEMTVGILGMAFKAESDDTRSSLSYKLKRILEFRARRVLCTDPYVTTDPSLVPLEEVLRSADLIVVGAPHADYRELEIDQPVADVWGLLGGGVRV
jgi:UDP-N-acetyl-D-mannosaminuronic acid dehydrogenase